MATNSKQLVMDFGFDSKGGSNVAGTLNVQGDLVTSGTFSFGSVSSNLVPDTAGTRNLGNTSNRWTLFSNSINAVGALTVTNTASVGNTTITGFANASVSVNSALLTVGTEFIANTSGAYHTTLVNSASFTTTGLLANTTAFVPTSNTILLGNTLGRFVLSANTGTFSGAVTGTVANMSTSVNSALLTVGTNFIANATQVTIGTGVLLSSNGTTGTAGHVLISNGSTGSPYWATFVPTIPAAYVQNTDSRTLSGNLVISGTSFTPSSNTILLGNSIQRWVLSANTGDFTGTVTGTVANMSTSVNSALFTVGTDFIANTSVILHTGRINAASFTTSGLLANTTALVATSNTILLGNSIGRFVLSANTGNFTGTVTGTVANMSTSVNSALLTVGTDFIANVSGAYHTGLVNAASHTTTGFVANTTAIVPTSNTILLGNTIGRFVLSANTGEFSGIVNAVSFTTTGLLANTTAFVPTSNTILLGNTIGRFVLSANTGDFTGTITGTVANMSTSVNSAILTVGSSFIANTSGVFHTATVNAASHTTSGFVANTTAIVPTSNTILLGNTIGRFVMLANTVDTSGLITGGAGATITGQVNASTGFGSGTIGAASNGLFANATTISIGNSTVNVAITPAGITSSGGTGINPSSNTLGTIFGTSTARWIVNANTGNFSGDTTLGGNVTISGTSHTVAGNVAFDTQVLFVDSFNNRVGINSSTPGVALEVSGAANVSTSVNSAMFTVGTSLIANASVILHTGTINAASHTTSGFVANTTAIAPTSNTILLGNSIGRFVLSANTGDFTGAVSGLSFSTSTLVANATAIAPTSNTILLGNTVGRFVLSANTGDFTGIVNAASFTATNLVANSSGVFHTGTVEAAIFNSTSDANSKYNIQTIEDPISKIMNMRGVTFTWKHSDKPSMGVIAQEVEPVIPEVVTTDANGKKSVSYDNIIGLLIEAIKNQQLQINTLINKAVRDGN